MARVLVVALFLLTFAGAAAARAQDGPAVVIVPGAPPSQAATSFVDPQGLVAATHVVCEIEAFRPLDPNTIHVPGYAQVVAFEVACAHRFGFIVMGSATGRVVPIAYACLGLVAAEERAAKIGVKCELKENFEFMPAAQALADAAGAHCAVSAVKWRGWSPSSETDVYELGCALDADGYLLSVAHGADPPKASTCLHSIAAACSLTPRAVTLAPLVKLAAQAGRPCEVLDGGYVARPAKEGLDLYEVACKGGDGFVVAVTPEGGFQHTMTCDEALNLGAGCTRSDLQVVNPGLVAKLKASGQACKAVRARLVGHTRDGREVVEFECRDQPAGLIVAFPDKPGDPVDAVDCLAASHFVSTCRFMTLDAQKDMLSRKLAEGGGYCAVSAFRLVGAVPGQGRMFEVACSGAPGHIVVLPHDYSRVGFRETCAEADRKANANVACTLAGNH